nr:glycosyltransferase [uncultured Butyrivibrio sp.]
MNIIFYRYNSICEPDYIEAFKRLGVDIIEDRDGMDNSLDIAVKLSKLGNMVSENRPLFIFSINYFPFLSILCQRLGILYVAVSVDCPVFEIFHTSIRNRVNRVFLFDRQQYLSVKDENPECIFHLPLGSACERTSALLGNEFKPQYDVSFIGSLYLEKDLFPDLRLDSDRKKRLLGMMEDEIHSSVSGFGNLESFLTKEDETAIKAGAKEFYPSDQCVKDMDHFVVMNDYIAPHMAYLERVELLNDLGETLGKGRVHLFTRSDTSKISDKVMLHGGVKSLEEMPFVFRNGRINLNISLRSIQTGLPQRIWDVLACRGFLLTNYQDEITDYFTPGVHLETYESRAELQEKIRYYLEHDEERARIAQQGFDEVCAKHTVLMRVMEMIRIIMSGK